MKNPRTQLTVIDGYRNEMGQKALSAILRRDTATFDDLMSKMQPRRPMVSIITGGLASGINPHAQPVLGQPVADKT